MDYSDEGRLNVEAAARSTKVFLELLNDLILEIQHNLGLVKTVRIAVCDT